MGSAKALQDTGDFGERSWEAAASLLSSVPLALPALCFPDQPMTALPGPAVISRAGPGTSRMKIECGNQRPLPTQNQRAWRPEEKAPGECPPSFRPQQESVAAGTSRGRGTRSMQSVEMKIQAGCRFLSSPAPLAGRVLAARVTQPSAWASPGWWSVEPQHSGVTLVTKNNSWAWALKTRDAGLKKRLLQAPTLKWDPKEPEWVGLQLLQPGSKQQQAFQRPQRHLKIKTSHSPCVSRVAHQRFFLQHVGKRAAVPLTACLLLTPSNAQEDGLQPKGMTRGLPCQLCYFSVFCMSHTLEPHGTDSGTTLREFRSSQNRDDLGPFSGPQFSQMKMGLITSMKWVTAYEALSPEVFQSISCHFCVFTGSALCLLIREKI